MIKEKKTGQVIVISSPSGAGKSSIVKALLERDNNLWLSVSTTTRAIRPGEKEGVNYNYVDKEEFIKKIDEGYFLEYTNYAGNYYGTPKKFIKEKIEHGTDVILEIEIEGAANIKKLIPEAIFIFILPPSLKVLLKRLKNRNTDSNEKIIERFHQTYKELNEITKYNYVVVNDVLEDAINKVESIIKAEKCRVDRIEEVYLDTKEEEIHELLINEEFNNEGINI
ncbi:MAG: guanylate kinase [Tenericutes bacterium]|nr:guanylate kinase [Mycoplasmatota bacterium]